MLEEDVMHASHEDIDRPDAMDATPADEEETRPVEDSGTVDEARVVTPLPSYEATTAGMGETPAFPEEAAAPEPVAEAAPPAEPDDGRAWYVIHCYSGYENKVRYNLEQRIDTMGMKDQIFDIVIPTIEEIEIKEGKRRNVERRVFPGYLLVQMLLTEESWYVVRNTPGVTGFVGMGNTPTALRPEEVTQILKRMETATPQVRPTYKAGQRVRVIDGPFNEFIGTVSDIDMDRGKVRVLVSFFGRETPVELDFLQVEKA
jgi:transcriptional antiterminator NusG